MRHKQAAAAVGQCSIMFLYDKFFGDYDKTIGQILLNAEDIEQEEKKEDQEARREQKGEPRPPVHKPKQKSRVRRHEDDEKL